MASHALATTLEQAAFPTVAHIPSVLVVDDDPECAAQCARILDDLNYRYYCATSAREALERLAVDPGIQIMLTDMQMKNMDGFVLIEEARARIGGGRPLAVIMLTDHLSADLAVRGLHVEAVDMLCKPLQFDAYSGALRRAMRYLGSRRGHAEPSMSNVSEQLTRLVSALESRSEAANADTAVGDAEISGTLRMIIGSRTLRSRFFPSQLFADPAWDILLDLARAKLDGQQVSVSSVCIAASVPMSTALRWVRQMTDSGLLRRWTDPNDRRRDLIALTDSTAAHMRDYLVAVYTAITKI